MPLSHHASLAVGLMALYGSAASADPSRCRLELLRRSARTLQAVTSALAECEDRIRTEELAPGTDCRTAPNVLAERARAEAIAAAAVARRCCGPDRTCGTGDDDTPASVGWTAGTCPDLAHRGCLNAIAGIDDVRACLACAAESAADLLAESLLSRLGAPAPDRRGCERTIVRTVERLSVKRVRALAACWARRARGAHASACADASGPVAAVLARADESARRAICRACGGPDGACDGVADQVPADLGFLATCPDVTPPGGASCAAPVTELGNVVDCIGCVTRFASVCAESISVPAFEPYAPTCMPSGPMLTTGALCTTALECPAGFLCRSNGAPTTHYCVGPPCTIDAECGGGAVCRSDCTTAGCGPARCQTPGFACTGADVLCIDDGGLACRKVCTQDSDCTDPYGLVCINPGFGFGVCIGTIPCQ